MARLTQEDCIEKTGNRFAAGRVYFVEDIRKTDNEFIKEQSDDGLL